MDRLSDLQRLSDLPVRMRDELERFFLNTTFFTSKNACILGWKDEEDTKAMVRETQPPR